MVRMGIVGCGAVAQYLHAPAIQESKSCILSACVDSEVERAKQLAVKYGVTTIATSIVDIAGKADAVLLAVPPHIRPTLAVEAMQLGLEVVCEKPLANSVLECKEISNCAVARQRVVSVFHQFRFWPNRIRIKEMLATGELVHPIQFKFEIGQPYSWASLTGYSVRKQFVPGGVAINAGIHPMDTLIWWFGDPLAFEYWDDSCGGIESNVRMSVEFKHGVSGELRLSRTCDLDNQFTLASKGLEIVINNNDPFTYDFTKTEKATQRTCVGYSDRGFLKPAADLYDDFASAIQNSHSAAVDAVEATRVIKWIEESYTQKKIRKLPALAPLPGMTW